MLNKMYGAKFELESADKLFGSKEGLAQIRAGADPLDLVNTWAAGEAKWRALRAKVLDLSVARTNELTNPRSESRNTCASTKCCLAKVSSRFKSEAGTAVRFGEPVRMHLPSRYVVGRELGRGGMGIVYEAEDNRLGRKVAIKVLHAGRESPARKHRFAQEARAASALNHPNIITIHDIDTADDGDFIVMELVERRASEPSARAMGRWRSIARSTTPSDRWRARRLTCRRHRSSRSEAGQRDGDARRR